MNARACGACWLAGLLAALPVASVASAIACTELADAASGRALVREGDCAERVTPGSTFKIAISLMGYDSGFLRDEHAPVLPFHQGDVDWNPLWRQATDPTSWIANSVVWYSQRVTAALGPDRFARYVDRFAYGNRDVSGDPGKHDGLGHAWIGSSLAISADEQVAFLARLVDGRLPVSARAVTMTTRLLRRGTTSGGWQIHGKSGTASPARPDGTHDDAHAYGWFVGWAVKGPRTIVFARLAQDRGDEAGPAGLRVRAAFEHALPALLESIGDGPG